MIALLSFLAAAVVHLADLSHCARVLATPQGYRCPVVVLRAPACRVAGWHSIGGTPVCVRGCGAEGKVRTP